MNQQGYHFSYADLYVCTVYAAFLFLVRWFISCGVKWEGVKLATCHHLIPRLRIRGVTIHFPLRFYDVDRVSVTFYPLTVLLG
jgi:hypothetical protein